MATDKRGIAAVPVVDWHAKYQDVVEQADKLDARRRHQVDLQKEVINRLLASRNWTWDQEMQTLALELAENRRKIEAVADYVVGMKYSNVARKVLEIVGDDA